VALWEIPSEKSMLFRRDLPRKWFSPKRIIGGSKHQAAGTAVYEGILDHR
jgi:hypothetical protein